MAVDVKTQALVLRKNSSDYPQYSLLESATNAIAKTLDASGEFAVDNKEKIVPKNIILT